MLIEANTATATVATLAPATFAPDKTTVADKIIEERKEKREAVGEEVGKSDTEKTTQAEELLDKIKALQDDGRFSVRFEQNKEIGDTVVKVWDIEKDELIRQFPAEELIDFKSGFRDLIGNIVNTTS